MSTMTSWNTGDEDASEARSKSSNCASWLAGVQLAVKQVGQPPANLSKGVDTKQLEPCMSLYTPQAAQCGMPSGKRKHDEKLLAVHVRRCVLNNVSNGEEKTSM